MPQVPLNLSCLPNSVIVSMRLPCKFDNVTASNSENNYTFINKVSCLSCITSQSEPNWAKTFLSDAHQAEVIFFVSFLDCGFSQMSGQIVSIIVKNLLERQIWYRQGALKWKRPHFRFTSVAQKRLWLSSPIMPLYTHDSLLVSSRWYHGYFLLHKTWKTCAKVCKMS